MSVADIAVLGGGPAGMAAAALAAQRGARVVLLDENAAPGGQVHRAPAPGLAAPRGAERAEGDRLRAALATSGAEVRCGERVWALGGGPLVEPGAPAALFRVDAFTAATATTLEARALILCPGTHERVIPFAGWTLPGVIGLAAATILLKAQATLPGRRTVVAGAGPLLLAVASGILKAGGKVMAVVDLAPRAEWLSALPALAGRPDLLGRGAGWLAGILRAGVPALSGHRVLCAHGEDAVEAVDVMPVGGGAVRRFGCDALCVGHGLVPATEAARLYGARHLFRPQRGGWVPVLDEWQRSSIPLLYVAGDGAGISGAAAAPLTGRRAAIAALLDIGRVRQDEAARLAANARREGAAASRVGAAMAGMMALRLALVAAIPADCVVCRCEDVTRREIEAALDDGARDLNQIKQFTRCGMGPCQGRMCGEAAAELAARRLGGREAVGLWTPRIPLRPVPMAALLGEFAYDDIPIPAPAPP